MPPMLLTLLTNKYVWIGILSVCFLGYIKVIKEQRDYYHKDRDKVVAQFTAYKEETKERTALLEHAATELSAKYEHSLGPRVTAANEKLVQATERIKKHAKAASTRVDPDIVELFNSAKPTDAVPQDVAPTKPADVSNTTGDSKTLTDLLLVTAENDTNHQKCIEVVKEWQNFWKDYSKGVTDASGPLGHAD